MPHRPLPNAFYTARTGIDPLDHVIRGVLDRAYAHHIERLMVLGNFMLLCEFEPDHVYRWFMELFIDAYDWVVVPNVYGMSLHADGGMITTKPYVSASSYILGMNDYRRGEWSEVWDGLFWRFIARHKELLRRKSQVVHDGAAARTHAGVTPARPPAARGAVSRDGGMTATEGPGALLALVTI